MAQDNERYERFRLTAATARAWYGNTLIGSSSAGSTAPVPAKPAPELMSTAAVPSVVATRHEVLVFHRPMPAAEKTNGMTFLSNVLKACKLSLNDVALFEGPGPGDLDTLRTTCDPRAMILFGIDPPATGLPLHVPHFQVMDHGGIKILSAPPIEEMVNDKQLKTALWNGLQKIFNP